MAGVLQDVLRFLIITAALSTHLVLRVVRGLFRLDL